MDKSKTARKLIAIIKEGNVKELVEQAKNNWAKFYESDDQSIRLIVDCMKKCNENDRYGYALALTNNINALYSAGIKYIHIRQVASHVSRALFGDKKSAIEEIAEPYDDGIKKLNYLSFASKVCSFYYDDEFAIYDSYMFSFLWEYAKEFELINTEGERIVKTNIEDSSKEVSDRYNKYTTLFNRVYKHFYNTFIVDIQNDFSVKEFDMIIWIMMKEYSKA